MNDLPILEGLAILPPMEDPDEPINEQKTPKGKPSRSKADCKKTANRFQVFNVFADNVAAELTRSEVLVWLVLFRDVRDGIARTAQSDIARRTKLSPRTVRYAIKGLVNRGLLSTVHQGGLNRGMSKYRVSAKLTDESQRQ